MAVIIEQDVFTLLREYAALAPPRLLHFPEHIPFTEINECLVNLILSGPTQSSSTGTYAHFQNYPPSKQYQRSFWKSIIARLEEKLVDDDEEIDARILDHYLSILSPSGPLSGSSDPSLRNQICEKGMPVGEAPSKSFVTHFWRPLSDNESPQTLASVNLSAYQTSTLLESRTIIESGTTGLRTWFASQMLARHLIRNPGIVQGKRVLELGSGVGFLAIVCASLQQLAADNESSSPHCIWLTDLNEEVLNQCRNNFQLPCNLSSAHGFAHFKALDWMDALDSDVTSIESLLQDEIDPDVVLGADIVFDPSLVPALVAVISLSLRPGPKCRQRIAIIVLLVRNPETFQLFWDNAQANGLKLEDIVLPQANEEPIFIDTLEPGTDQTDVRALKITLKRDI